MAALVQIHFDPVSNSELLVMLLGRIELLDHLRPPGDAVPLAGLDQQWPGADQAHDVAVGKFRQPAAEKSMLFFGLEEATVARVGNYHLVAPLIEPGGHHAAFDSRLERHPEHG